jgi:hypothetical protein
MRCPKCGYVSFDHNSTCPKCNKDISLEQTKMNLPAYMPDPPRLLEVLTGMADDSPMDFGMDNNINQGASLDQDSEMDTNDTGTIEMPEEAIAEDNPEMDLEFDTIDESDAQEETVMYSESPILESLGNEDGTDLGLEQITEEASDTVAPTPPPLPQDELDEVTLDLDDLGDGEEELTKAVAQATGEIEALDLDLDDIAIDNGDSKGKMPKKVTEVDEAEMITMEINKKKMKGKEKIEDIDLDEIDELVFDEPQDK